MTEHDRSADAVDIKSFYSQLLHLLEFTRDMDRNTDDGKFAKSRGTIHYVLDENVFEFFVGARTQHSAGGRSEDLPASVYEDKRKYSAVFHLDAWRDRPSDNSKERHWTRVNRQTAVITAEYLLASALPGQSERKLYLTEWHWRELKGRFKVLLDHFVSRANKAISEKPPMDHIQHEIDAVLKLAHNPDVEVAELIAGARLEPIDRIDIEHDVARLKDSEIGINSETLLKFTTARIIASKLIDDDILEPLQQIKRVSSREIMGHLHPLQLLSPRPDPDAQRHIREHATAWACRIAEEEDKRDLPAELRRESGRLAVDAASLARVQWLADRLDSDRDRIVLITGDTLVFDAYRRWWSERPDTPFILRRVTQYAPILNFKDAGSGVSSSEATFENIRRAIEPALMFFNLVERAVGEEGRPSAPARHGAREHFALLLKDKDALAHPLIKGFTRNVVSKIIERKQDHLQIRDKWQELERLAIGINHHLIESRLSSEQSKRLRSMIADGRGMEQYINETLDELYTHNATLYVPDIFRALKTWLRGVKTPTRRAPIAMRLHVALSEKQEQQDIGDLVDDLIMHAGRRYAVDQAVYALENVDWLSQRPELLFAIAAVVALRFGLWNHAAEYAQLAAGADSAMQIKGQQDREDQADYFELLYLRAVANRFRIGDLPSSASDTDGRAKELLTLARADLDACIAHHRGGTGERRHILRECRALSERAALSLFYASFKLRAENQSLVDQERAVAELLSADDDLRTAADMFSDARERARELDEEQNTTQYSGFFDLVEERVIINRGACYVFAQLFERNDGRPVLTRDGAPLVQGDVTRELIARLAELRPSPEKSHALADRSAFLWLFDRDAVARNNLRQLAEGGGDMLLRIDAELMRIYGRMLPPEPDEGSVRRATPVPNERFA